MNDQEHSKWELLCSRYLSGTISREELDEMLRMAENGDDLPGLSAVMRRNWDDAKQSSAGSHLNWSDKYRQLMEEAEAISPAIRQEIPIRRQSWKRLAAAAAVLLVLGLAAWLFISRRSADQSYSQHIATQSGRDILPGTNGAILTLGNGDRIVLDSAGAGTLAVQGGMAVIQGSGGLRYDGKENRGKDVVFNTVQTPRGKQFRLLLADGSAVWLNAASSIRFPAAFTGAERRVEISGEAYFEVAKQDGMPFVVMSRGMEVRVLGTHFNVQAYEDEAAMETTLLEGSVEISAGGQQRRLRPGEQSIVNGEGEIKVQHEVNTDAVMAWKNGYFSFDQTSLYAVMRQLARWYDVEIEYEGRIPDRRFGGDISRNSKASEVLRILEASNVHFRIEDKKIIVMP